MAKQKRKPAQQAPITANPLFPAVVALWFGALFGLGSLAVRPTLIEDLVLSSRIDLVIPAAAPPLGMTARIMLALIMAVLGAIIGVVLARRLTRPKPEVRERSRAFGSKQAEPVYHRARDAHPDAPTCQPISMRDIDPDGTNGRQDNAIAGRRRGLTADHAEEEFMPHEFAPLPGGGEPQILDRDRGGPPMVAPLSPAVVESGLSSAASQFEAASAPPPAFQPPAQAAPAPMPFAPAAFTDAPVTALPIQQSPVQQASFEPIPAAAAPMQFQPVPAAPEIAMAAPALPPETAAAHADGRQVFGMQPAEPQTERPRQIFGQAVEGDHVPQDFIREAGYRTTVFEQEVPAPLFNREAEVAAPVSAPAQFVAPEPAPAPVAAAAVPQTYEPLPAAPAAAPEPLELTAMVAETVPAAMPAPVAAPAPAAPLPSPAGLGMTDLATRLAESMRRRRAAKAGVPVAEAAPAPLPELPPAPTAFEAPQPAAIPAAIPEAYAPPAAHFEAAPEPAPIPQSVAAPEPAPVPQAFVAPTPAPVPQAFTAAEPAPVPQAFVPEPEPQPATFAAPAPAAPSLAPAAGLELPSALRPLALDAFLEDDGQFDNSLLPPRHIAMSQPAAQPAPEPVAAPADAFAPIPPAVPDIVPGEEAVVEESYASLLGIGQARAGFVRIDEPEPDLSDPEPVVIFPGQAPNGQAAMAAAPAPFGANDGAALRRFDSPAAAGAGQPVDLGAAPPAVPATEAEQALRSALASLQRISGAA